MKYILASIPLILSNPVPEEIVEKSQSCQEHLNKVGEFFSEDAVLNWVDEWGDEQNSMVFEQYKNGEIEEIPELSITEMSKDFTIENLPCRDTHDSEQGLTNLMNSMHVFNFKKAERNMFRILVADETDEDTEYAETLMLLDADEIQFDDIDFSENEWETMLKVYSTEDLTEVREQILDNLSNDDDELEDETTESNEIEEDDQSTEEHKEEPTTTTTENTPEVVEETTTEHVPETEATEESETDSGEEERKEVDINIGSFGEDDSNDDSDYVAQSVHEDGYSSGERVFSGLIAGFAVLFYVIM